MKYSENIITEQSKIFKTGGEKKTTSARQLRKYTENFSVLVFKGIYLLVKLFKLQRKKFLRIKSKVTLYRL